MPAEVEYDIGNAFMSKDKHSLYIWNGLVLHLDDLCSGLGNLT